MRWTLLVVLFVANVAAGQPAPVLLQENFTPDTVTRVRLESNLSGRLAVPQEGKKTPDVLPFNGKSVLEYDERPLPVWNESARVARQYHTVELTRTIGDRPQSAEVRPAVRRMVVLRGAGLAAKKVPFSPDGPLTLGEIDVVRIDLFSSVLVPGLLPTKPVQPGDRWPVTDLAVADLTDYETVETNQLSVEFSAVVMLGQARLAKLLLSGTVTGLTEDGASRQALSGTAYFDLDANRLSYLKLIGKNQLLGPKGVTAGEVTGTFTLTRGPTPGAPGLAPETLARLELAPTPTNSRLLHTDPEQGLQFHYPRRWRVDQTAGSQTAVDETNGQAGVLFTRTSREKTPTAAAFLAEVKAFGAKQKWQIVEETPPTVDSTNPALERFTLRVTTAKGEAIRLEYGVMRTAAGGVTVAARLGAGPDLEALTTDVIGMMRSVAVSRPSE